MLIQLILIIQQAQSWLIPIEHYTICSCQQITDYNLCRQSPFCELDMDYVCVDVLDYNCSYFSEQTVIYLCSSLARCQLKDEQCVELTNCTDLQGSNDQDCQSKSKRCGTVSQSGSGICELTQCSSYINEEDCNNSIRNLRFDDIGYGNICYWNDFQQECQVLQCENVSVEECTAYKNLCQVVNNLCTWAVCTNQDVDECEYVWNGPQRTQIQPCIVKNGFCQDATEPSEYTDEGCTTNTLYTYMLENDVCTSCSYGILITISLLII